VPVPKVKKQKAKVEQKEDDKNVSFI